MSLKTNPDQIDTIRQELTDEIEVREESFERTIPNYICVNNLKSKLNRLNDIKDILTIDKYSFITLISPSLVWAFGVSELLILASGGKYHRLPAKGTGGALGLVAGRLLSGACASGEDSYSPSQREHSRFKSAGLPEGRWAGVVRDSGEHKGEPRRVD